MGAWQTRSRAGLRGLQSEVEKVDRGNDPGLEMGQRMWQKVKGGEGG